MPKGMCHNQENIFNLDGVVIDTFDHNSVTFCNAPVFHAFGHAHALNSLRYHYKCNDKSQLA